MAAPVYIPSIFYTGSPCPHAKTCLSFDNSHPFVVWGVVSLWFWYALPWWLVMLSIFLTSRTSFGKMSIQICSFFKNQLPFLFVVTVVVFELYAFLFYKFWTLTHFQAWFRNILSHPLYRVAFFILLTVRCAGFLVWYILTFVFAFAAFALEAAFSFYKVSRFYNNSFIHALHYLCLLSAF